MGLFWTWLGYLTFVVYGSLVPFEPSPVPLAEAWQQFAQIRLLDVGAQGRADWIANGVLYFPLGFLTAALLTRRAVGYVSVIAWLAALVFGIGVAIGVEFMQLSFPPRTVSLNDLIAETLGVFGGASAALLGAARFRGLLDAIQGDPRWLAGRLLGAYLAAYALLSFFPYDLVLSREELAAQLRTGNWGLLLAPASHDQVVRLLAKLAAEMLAAVPIGILLAQRWRTASPRAIAYGLLLGAAIGLAIEGAQLLLISGVTQGLSILTRALGVGLGLVMAQWLAATPPRRILATLRRYGVVTGLLYLLALISVNHWLSGTWQGWDAARAGLAATRFLPFYYHYYTSEAVAMMSALAVIGMYAPVGLLALINGIAPLGAAAIALVLVTLIEGSKLFLAGLHPDPTNALIAPFVAWAACVLAGRMLQATATPRVDDESAPQRPPAAPPSRQARRMPLSYGRIPSIGQADLGQSDSVTPPVKQPGTAHLSARRRSDTRPASRDAGQTSPLRARVPLLILTALTILWLGWRLPFHGPLVALALAIYAGLIWKRPTWLVAALPVGLVTVDLAPWTGWYFIDAFDALLLVSLLVAYARLPRATDAVPWDRLSSAIWMLFGLSLLIGIARASLPLQLPELSGIVPYFSPYNALRIAKGALWALLTLHLLRRLAALDVDVLGLFSRGMVVGLAVVVAAVLWERGVFPGLFELADVYRVTGPFSQMHIGGADLETDLTAAIPFLVLATVASRGGWRWLAGALLFVLSVYCVLVTFSRVAYAGFAVAVLVTLLAYVAAVARSGRVQQWSRWGLKASGLFVLAIAIAVPILGGPFAQERLARIGTDLESRVAHWRDALAIRDQDWATTLFGMGIGRYPETHYWRSTEPRAARFTFATEGGNGFVRLGAGLNLYVDQPVLLGPQDERAYQIALRLRGPSTAATLRVYLCEKWLLTSTRCRSLAFRPAGHSEWRLQRARLTADGLDSGNPLVGRTVKLSFQHAGGQAAIDVDDIQLLGPDGRNLIANGDFSRGLDRWFFSVDSDLPWHIWSLPLAVLFDQGWLGLLAVAVLFVAAIVRATRAIWNGDPRQSAVLGALLGILVVGTMNTIIDSPRMLFLVLILVSLGLSKALFQSRRQPGAEP